MYIKHNQLYKCTHNMSIYRQARTALEEMIYAIVVIIMENPLL